AELKKLVGPDGGMAEHLDGRPRPECVAFLAGQVGALAGGGVAGPDLERGAAADGKPDQGLAGGGELLPRRGLPCRREEGGGVLPLSVRGADQGGQSGTA